METSHFLTLAVIVSIPIYFFIVFHGSPATVGVSAILMILLAISAAHAETHTLMNMSPVKEAYHKWKAKQLPDNLWGDQKARGESLMDFGDRPGLMEFNPKLKTCHKYLQDFAQYLWNRIQFRVTACGRSLAEQKKNVEKGASATMRSYHLRTPSLAMDIVAYADGKITWKLPYYYKVAGWFMDWAGERTEQKILKGYRPRPGIVWVKPLDAVHFELRPLKHWTPKG